MFGPLLRTAFIGIALLGALEGVPSVSAQTVASEESVRSVRRMLERLPYYGVFDFLAFSIERGTVTLVGYDHRGTLRADAEIATRRVSGVDEIANRIELLPASQADDRIRWATFYKIYADDSLSRYAPGGAPEVFRELLNGTRFPGMQPIGSYPIHIIVKNGRTMLLGVVDSAVDRQLAEVRAREVSGVFAVENDLRVLRP
jgi:hyperosmotically inducible periplasmic protein